MSQLLVHWSLGDGGVWIMFVIMFPHHPLKSAWWYTYPSEKYESIWVIIPNWLVVWTPPKNMSQSGWFSQYVEKMFQSPPTSQYIGKPTCSKPATRNGTLGPNLNLQPHRRSGHCCRWPTRTQQAAAMDYLHFCRDHTGIIYMITVSTSFVLSIIYYPI